MRAQISKTGDPRVDAAFKAVDETLKRISTDNYKGVVISGVTSSSADTQAFFKHTLATVPAAYFPIEGDVYIPSGGYGTDKVDVRSRLASHKFSILVFV